MWVQLDSEDLIIITTAAQSLYDDDDDNSRPTRPTPETCQPCYAKLRHCNGMSQLDHLQGQGPTLPERIQAHEEVEHRHGEHLNLLAQPLRRVDVDQSEVQVSGCIDNFSTTTHNNMACFVAPTARLAATYQPHSTCDSPLHV